MQQRGIRALPSLGSHTELPSAPSGKELTFLHRFAPPLKQIGSLLELYITGNKLEQTKTGGTGAGKHTHNFSRRLNSISEGRPRGPNLLIKIEAPHLGQVKVVHVVLPEVG